MGELTEVRRDGAVVETYAYDLDGDRTSQGGDLRRRRQVDRPRRRRTTRSTPTASSHSVGRRVHLRPQRRAALGHGRRHDRHVRVRRVRAHGRADQGAATTRYVYGDPDSPYRVSAARAPGRHAGPLPVRPAREPLRDPARRAARFHVATDQVGSPRVVVDADGNVVKRLEYDAYGVTTDLDPGFFLPFGYAGGLRDPVTGLVRFGLRDYEPQSGRFTARDPARFAGSPRSLYGYAEQLARHLPRSRRHGVDLVRRLLRARRRRHPLLRPLRALRPQQAARSPACAASSASVSAAASRPTSSSRRRRTGASLRSPSSARRSGPVGGKVGGEFDLICGTGKGKVGRQPRAAPAAASTATAPERGLRRIDPSADDWREAWPGRPRLKVEGKVGLKACLPPPPS